MQNPSWGVAATVAEPAPLVIAFVAHHLFLGAQEVHLFFDDPADPAADAFTGMRKVLVTRCTGEWWEKQGLSKPPKVHTRRQFVNATAANARSNVDALLHCDADEFLRLEDDFEAEIADLSPDRPWLKIPNCERSLMTGKSSKTIFDGVFKTFDGEGGVTRHRTHALAPHGFTGHGAGKGMTLTRLGLEIGIHAPRRGRMRDRDVPPHALSSRAKVLHFDGLTPLHWAAKMLRYAAQGPEVMARIVGERRMEQTKAVIRAIEDPAALLALYEGVNGLTTDEILALDEHELIDIWPLEISAALEAIFPGTHVDISPASFDRILQPRVDAWLKQARKFDVFFT